MNLIGRTLANYKIEYELGRGGMAQVFYGQDIKLHRPVAIKVINAKLQGNPEFAKRFIDEARLVASWRHENIIQVYYADNIDDLYFFAMEYIEGMSLSDLLQEYNGELIPHEDVILIGTSIANALDYAHQKGVIHRDIKPANVMISDDDRVVLADFGLALDLQQGSMGQVFGTPHYISPEQARRSSDAVPQSDLYSLGVMLYEMLTGVVPFDDPSAATLAVQHLTMPPPPPRSINPDLSTEVEAVLLKSLEKSPDDRYQTGGELMNALENALTSSPKSLQARSNLPPMPAGIASASPPTVAKMSISQKIAISLKDQQSHQTKAAKTRVQSTKLKSRKKKKQKSSSLQGASSPKEIKTQKQQSWMLYGLIAVVAIVMIGGSILFLTGKGNDNTSEVTTLPTQVSQTTDIPPTDTNSSPSETLIPPSPTNIPATSTVAVVSATEIPPTNTITMPTATPIVPTATIVPPTNTVHVPTETPIPTATVLYPNGRLIELHYNADSFVMWNGGADSFRVSQIVFEAINSGSRFEGVRWTLFGFNVVESFKCNVIVSGSANSGKCTGINSEIQPNSTESFWIALNNITQFRVLWNNEEIGRCEISAGICTVYAPQ